MLCNLSPRDVERVKAGLRNAKSKGKRLGRPQLSVDSSGIAGLRARGCSWRTIAKQLGCSARTARRIGSGLAKNTSATVLGSDSIAADKKVKLVSLVVHRAKTVSPKPKPA